MGSSANNSFDAEVRRIDMPANFRVSNHVHPGWHLLAVTAGMLTEETGTGTRRMSQQSLRLSPPDSSHDLRFGPEGASCLLVAIPERWIVRRWRDPLASEGSRFVDDPDIVRCLLGIDLDGAGFEAEILREIGIRRVIALIAKRRDGGGPARPPDWLATLTSRLEAIDSPPRISDLAGGLGLSREHLARVFHSFTGYSPSQYRIAIRFLQAARMLARPHANLRVTATDSGFSHQSHFTNQCRPRMGVRPSALRSPPALLEIPDRLEPLGGSMTLPDRLEK